MSWKPMSPAVSPGGQRKDAAPVALSGIVRGGNSKTCLVLRPPMLDEPGWMKAGARIQVLEGAGEHAGMLRVVPDPRGPFVLSMAGGKRNVSTLMVFLPWPGGGVRPVKQPPMPVEFDHGADWLEVTLPAWARPPAPAVAGAAAAAAAAREKAGYVGVTARVPDQAAQDRVGARRAGGL